MSENKVKTDIDTLSKAWELMEEIGISGMLLGKAIKVDPQELFGALFSHRKLIAFIEIVTGLPTEQIKVLKGPEVVSIIADFFTLTISEWSSLTSIMGTQIASETAPETKTT